jgi:WD40 repeat protein
LIFWVILGSFDATVRLWDCKSQSTKPIQVFEEARDSISSLEVVGWEIVTGSVDGRMRLYDVRMGMVFVDVVGREYALFSLGTLPCVNPFLCGTFLVGKPFH